MFYRDWGQHWTASALPGNDRGFEGRERGRGAERPLGCGPGGAWGSGRGGQSVRAGRRSVSLK